MENIKKIIHIDMDAFFASVEERDNPGLRGKPVIVGGDPAGRGVVAACSYAARRFGVHSAMSCAKALRICPKAVFVRPRKERYRQISHEIMAIFSQYSDMVEPLSVDEAFLDVTENKKKIASATWTAQTICREIFANTGLTASAGVSYNKFLAKVASDENKPNGITVITPEKAIRFICGLPVRKFYGVGKVTEKKMHTLGIKTGADLVRYEQNELISFFGKAGNFFYNIVRGVDNRPVGVRKGNKSVGGETTVAKDLDNINEMMSILNSIAERIEASLTRKKLKGRTISLKIRYFDFLTVTRSCTFSTPFNNASFMMASLPRLLASTRAGQKKVRLLGISVSNFPCDGERPGYYQLPLPFPPCKQPEQGYL
jgi:DNA polymerase-4